MVAYPQLTQHQQSGLPALKQAATALPVLFEDSTHKRWHCDTAVGPMVLKICDRQTVEASVFWQGLNSLFKADFPASLGDMAAVYQKIAVLTELTVPDFIASGSGCFVLAAWLAGEPVDASRINDVMVVQLANHLAKCHQQTQTTWGAFSQAIIPAQNWSTCLSATIKQLVGNAPVGLSETIVDQALRQAQAISAVEFSPIMLDLRWDQFLQHNHKLSALVDLDAFVIGPREIEFVLLEYLLTKRQAAVFKKVYQEYHAIPELTQVRICYRLLLFLMSVLGEKSLKQWFNMPAKF